MVNFDLTGRAALVTGGNGGIGLGIAAGLAEAGASVMIAARNEEKSEDALASITSAGGTAASIRCDVRSPHDIEAAVAATVEQFGRLDVLVPNAGIGVGKRPEQMTEEDWASVIDINLTGVFRCCQTAYPHLVESENGSIITITSMYGIFGSPVVSSYSASKGGVVQLTKSLATAWARDGVRVNGIAPGWIRTELTSGLLTEAGKKRRETIVDRTPMGKIGEPEDLAGAAVFLASKASAFVTGHVLAVDGGYSIA